MSKNRNFFFCTSKLIIDFCFFENKNWLMMKIWLVFFFHLHSLEWISHTFFFCFWSKRNCVNFLLFLFHFVPFNDDVFKNFVFVVIDDGGEKKYLLLSGRNKVEMEKLFIKFFSFSHSNNKPNCWSFQKKNCN